MWLGEMYWPLSRRSRYLACKSVLEVTNPSGGCSICSRDMHPMWDSPQCSWNQPQILTINNAVTHGGGLDVKLCPTLATAWTVAHQAPLSMGFFRQEYWSWLHFLLQGIFLTQGANPGLLHCRQILYPLSYEGSSSNSWILVKVPIFAHEVI